jgi:hypothetical protein
MREPAMRMKNKGAVARTEAIDSGRRQALVWAGAALLGAAGVAFATRRAGAITLVEADAEVQAAFHQACGPVAYHQQLLDDLHRKLANGGKLDRAAEPVVGCPVCGCRLRLEPPKGAAR